MSVDFYLKLDGVTGESQVDGHVGEIQLLSFDFNGNMPFTINSNASSGIAMGKVNLATVNVTKTTDSSTITLFSLMCSGTGVATATISAVKAGGNGKPFLTVQFTWAFVAHMELAATTEVPVETIYLGYRAIKLSYFAQNPDGTMVLKGSRGWDIARNVSTA